MADSKKAILETLLYSTLFNFPLTKNEIYYYLHSNKVIPKKEFEKKLASLENSLVFKDNFYTLKDNEKSVDLRKKRLVISNKKRLDALKIVKVLGYIPTVLFIGISGSVAVGNAEDPDDIDFFIITTNNSLYTTRLLMLLILQLLGRRRKRNELKPQNKICLNMLVDEDGMSFEKSQSIYTARELLQMYPLFERQDYYQKLLAKNNWTNSFMSHAHGQNNKFIKKKLSFIKSFFLVDPLCRSLEQSLIKRNQTRETATHHVIALHPLDTKTVILAEIDKRRLHYSKYYSV